MRAVACRRRDTCQQGVEESNAGEALYRAFTFLYESRFDNDAKRKAELIFMGNTLVGVHEQIRLQEPIEGALQAPITRKLNALEQRFSIPGIGLLKRLFAVILRDLEGDWQRIATEVLLSLALPTMRLDLGDDIPPLPTGQLFPDDLKELVHPDANALIKEWDYMPHTTQGSAARDQPR